MTIKKFLFKGGFCRSGEVTINAPDEQTANEVFSGVDFGNGYGCSDERDVESIECIGVAYEFDGDAGSWIEAVKAGDVE